LPTNANWLFFSSKNGVKYFFETQISNLKSQIKIAAINTGTAQAINKLGLKVDFIGNSGDLIKIATDFDAIATGKIIFPQAKKSMQTIQKKLTNKDIETLVVYQNTIKLSIKNREEEILIFTSPMNVEAYFNLYKPTINQQIISIGQTTTKKLQSYNIQNIHTAYEPTQWSLLDEVFMC
jgi:uroporphyrinogen-III synthase